MCFSISDNAWSPATLPFCMGGLGLRESQFSSHTSSLSQVMYLSPDFGVPFSMEDNLVGTMA